MLDRHTTVHNATVCVDFVEKDTFMGISFVGHVPKNCFLFAFFNYLSFDTLSFYTSNNSGGGGRGLKPPCPSPLLRAYILKSVVIFYCASFPLKIIVNK